MDNSPVDKLLSLIAWTPTGATDNGSGLPYATHSGVLEIGDIRLRCYQLNDGRRLIDAEDMKRLFGLFTD